MGRHIATDVGPLYHYNFSSYGSRACIGSLQVWPITIMQSDGTRVVAAGSGFNVIGSQDHQSRGYDSALNPQLMIWPCTATHRSGHRSRNTAHRPYWALERIMSMNMLGQRTRLTFLGQTTDITEAARPGNKITIPSNVPITDSPLQLQSQNFDLYCFRHPTIHEFNLIPTNMV